MLAAQHFHRDLVNRGIVGAEEMLEVDLDTIARFDAERIGERDRLPSSLLCQHLRSHARGRHREQFGADIDGAEQHHLPPLKLGSEAHHCMKDRAPEMTSGSLDVTNVACEFAELAIPS